MDGGKRQLLLFPASLPVLLEGADGHPDQLGAGEHEEDGPEDVDQVQIAVQDSLIPKGQDPDEDGPTDGNGHIPNRVALLLLGSCRQLLSEFMHLGGDKGRGFLLKLVDPLIKSVPEGV